MKTKLTLQLSSGQTEEGKRSSVNTQSHTPFSSHYFSSILKMIRHTTDSHMKNSRMKEHSLPCTSNPRE